MTNAYRPPRAGSEDDMDAAEAIAALEAMAHEAMGEFIEILEPEDGKFVVRNRYSGTYGEGPTLLTAIENFVTGREVP